MMAADFTEMDIHLALDGELPKERLREFNAWLEANPEMRHRAATFDADRQRLQTALGPVAYEPVPGKLTQTIFGNGREVFGLNAWWRGGIAAALLLAAGVGGYALGALRAPPPTPVAYAGEPIAERAVTAHRIFAPEKLHVVEVGADQRDHLVSWLTRRMGRPLTAPDLKPQGFDLIGGRLLPSGDGAAAQFMYEDATGNRISLYLTPSGGTPDTGFRHFRNPSAGAYYWVDAGFGQAVVGNVPDPIMEAAARSAYRQLLSVGH